MSTSKELAILISGNAAGGTNALKQTKAELQGIATGAKAVGPAAEQGASGLSSLAGTAAKLGAVTAAVGGAAVAVKAFGIDAVQAASNMNESANKVDVVFGQSATAVKEFAATAAQSLGQSSQEAMAAAGQFGNLFTAMKMGQPEAAKLSIEVVKLGSDLASFHNIRPEDALEKLRAGLVGEMEPLRALGVAINAEMVEVQAMKMGLVDASGAVTEAGKVQARYALILQQTQAAQGDFARTSDGMANATRIIEASFKDLQVQIGQEVLPILAPLISNFAKSIPEAMKAARPFIEGVGDAARDMGDLLGKAGEAATKFREGVASEMAHMKEDAKPGTEAINEVSNAWVEMHKLAGEEPPVFTIHTQFGDAWAAMQELRTGWINLKNLVEGTKISSSTKFGGHALEDTLFDPDSLRESVDIYDNYVGVVENARARSLAAQSAASIQWGRDLDDINASAFATERAADDKEAAIKKVEAAAVAAAKHGASEAESAAKREQTAIENTIEKAEELAYKMESAAGELTIDLQNMAQAYGDAWIDKWGDVNDAIKSAQSSASAALSEMQNQEILSASIAARKGTLDERLKGEAKIFNQQQTDTEYHHREELQLAKLSEDEQRDLKKATSDRERQDIRNTYRERRDAIATEHMAYDSEVKWRMGQEEQAASFAKRQEGERAALEKTLHEEELNRRRAAIEEEAARKITAINNEWAQWQTTEAAKLAMAQANAKADAKGKFEAWRDDFIRKMPPEAQAAANQIKAIVDAAFGTAIASTAGGSDSGGGGVYVEPTTTQVTPTVSQVFGVTTPVTATVTQVTPTVTQVEPVYSYGSGGTVGGAFGAPQLAIVHGGETVIPNGGGGGGTVINLTVNGSVVTEGDLVNAVYAGLLRKQRYGGTLGLN